MAFNLSKRKKVEYNEFQKRMQNAHNCLKCQNKIFCVSVDKLGKTRCAYCNEIVVYPSVSKEQLEIWTKESPSV